MGALAALALTGAVLIAFYNCLTQPDERKKLAASFLKRPIFTSYVFVYCGSTLGLFWAVMLGFDPLITTPMGAYRLINILIVIVLAGLVIFLIRKD